MFKKNFLQKGMIDLNVHKSSALIVIKGSVSLLKSTQTLNVKYF